MSTKIEKLNSYLIMVMVDFALYKIRLEENREKFSEHNYTETVRMLDKFSLEVAEYYLKVNAQKGFWTWLFTSMDAAKVRTVHTIAMNDQKWKFATDEERAQEREQVRHQAELDKIKAEAKRHANEADLYAAEAEGIRTHARVAAQRENRRGFEATVDLLGRISQRPRKSRHRA